MKTTKTKSFSNCLYVEGNIWQGCNAIHFYLLGEADKMPRCYEEIKSIAGDFDFITKAEIIRTVTITETKTKKIDLGKLLLKS